MEPGWPEPKTVQHWPGKLFNELANKVPTLLQYKENSREVKAWGFLCDLEAENTDILACFKLHLDPEHNDQRPDAPKVFEARQWFQDYLHCIYQHIEDYFSRSFPRWKEQNTEFVFSVPTTWKSPNMISEMESLIAGAGFGSAGPHRRSRIGLTEAEAAAVYASKQNLQVGGLKTADATVPLHRRLIVGRQRNDVVLVCDAGGGTTVRSPSHEVSA